MAARHLGSALLRRIASYGAIGSSSSRTFSSQTSKGTELLEGLEHATGLEKAEKDGATKGINIFTEGEAWLQAPFGTPEKPVVVTSSFSERIVGVTDPEDDRYGEASGLLLRRSRSCTPSHGARTLTILQSIGNAFA